MRNIHADDNDVASVGWLGLHGKWPLSWTESWQ